LDANPTAVLLLQSLIFLLQLPKPAPAGPPAPASHGRLCCRAGLTAPPYYHRWLGLPSTHPHPLLFSGDGSLTPQPNQSTLVLPYVWASTAVSSPAPRSSLPGLTVVHRLGALGAAWSTWSMNDSLRKKTVRGEADSWTHELHLRTQGNASLLRAKKRFLPPDSWDPAAISSYARKCLLILPDSWDPPGQSVRSVVCLVANVYVHTGRSVFLQR
jgi:hypothetical protein